jgi:starch synthase
VKVAFITPELQSLVRRTQLAEIAEQLPSTLRHAGTDARVFLPFHQDIAPEMLTELSVVGTVEVKDDGSTLSLTVHAGMLGQLPVYLIDHPALFRTRHPYGDDSGPYADNWRRYAIFSRAVLEAMQLTGFSPDVIHCLDWSAGLVPLIQELEYIGRDHAAARAGTYFAVHNMAMQGAFEREVLPKIGIPHSYFRAIEGVEQGGKVNFLKAGAEFATVVGTQSPAQVERVQQLDGGNGMEATFRRRSKELLGLLNGIDYRAWDPSNDPLLAQNYAATDEDLAGKRKCKATLQAGLKLDNGPRTPLVTIIGRFDSDSGFDVLAEALTPMLERNIELVLMGPGQVEILDRLRTVEQTFAGRCRLIDAYHVGTAHTLLGGADILLLPGHFHSSNALCAIAMRYGVVPIVYSKSGLEDTVKGYEQDAAKGLGFLFSNYTSESLLEGVDAARALYKKAPEWKTLVQRCLNLDFSWQESARNYLKAYRRVTRRTKERRRA